MKRQNGVSVKRKKRKPWKETAHRRPPPIHQPDFTTLQPERTPTVRHESNTQNVEYEEKSHKTTPASKNASARHRRGHNSQLPSVNVSFVLLLICSQFCDLPLVLPHLISTIQYAATPVTVVFCLMRTTALTLKSRAATWVEVCAKPAMQSQRAAMTSPVLVMMTHGRRGVSFIRWEGSTCTHMQTTVRHVLLWKQRNKAHS